MTAQPQPDEPAALLQHLAIGKSGPRMAGRAVVGELILGADGPVPLEVRFHHDPDSSHGFVGAAVSSNIIHWYKKDGQWIWEKIIDVENVRQPEWPIPVPGLISVILISMTGVQPYHISRLGEPAGYLVAWLVTTTLETTE